MKSSELTPAEEAEDKKIQEAEDRLWDEKQRIIDGYEGNPEVIDQAFRDFITDIVAGNQNLEITNVFGQMMDVAVSCPFEKRHEPLNQIVDAAIEWQARKNLNEN